jgi:hypothetical protein
MITSVVSHLSSDGLHRSDLRQSLVNQWKWTEASSEKEKAKPFKESALLSFFANPISLFSLADG